MSCPLRMRVILGLLVAMLGGLPASAQMQVSLPAAYDAGPGGQTPVADEPFGLIAEPVASGEVPAKWSGVEAAIRAEAEILARCRGAMETCPPAAKKFLDVIAEGRANAGRARIGVVNRAVNLAIRPTSDLAQWGVLDRWSTPLTTLTTGLGDCEDYAIAKYVALREAGVAEEDVRIVIVRDLVVGEDHALVASRLDGRWLVLDNRRLVLLQDVELRQILPLFVLDRGGVKQFAPTVAAAEGRARALTSAPASLGF